jgi:hypothetical protein
VGVLHKAYEEAAIMDMLRDNQQEQQTFIKKNAA